jgi:hypothetical protein
MNDEIKRLQRVTRCWKFIGIALLLNFIIWTGGMLYLGGEAVTGKEEGGYYYLHSRKGYTEVSAQVYQYSKIHTYTVYVSGPFCLLAILAANRSRVRLRAMMGEWPC